MNSQGPVILIPSQTTTDFSLWRPTVTKSSRSYKSLISLGHHVDCLETRHSISISFLLFILFSPEHNPGLACFTLFQLTCQSLQCKTPSSLSYITSDSLNKCQCRSYYRDGVLIIVYIVMESSMVYSRTAVPTRICYRNCSNFAVFLDASGLCPYRSNIISPGLKSIFKLRINMYAVVPAKI